MRFPVSPSRRLAPPLVLVVVAACCPTSKALRHELANGAEGVYLAGVPFVRQERNFCGPAALASVAAFYGLDVSQDEIAREVYLPSIRASLTIDLERCAKDHGLWCRSGRGDLATIRQWLDRGVPVVALIRKGPLAGGLEHYVVLVGYHASRRYFIAHTGYFSNRPISFDGFARDFRRGGRWFLAACPPEKVTWPLSANELNDLGLLFERKGDLEKALRNYLKAIAADPGQPVFHFNLGNALFEVGRLDEAERSYREAIRLRPAFAEAHNNLAGLLLKVGRLHEAYREARRAVAIDGPRAAQFHETLGRVLLALKSYAAAARAFRRAISEGGKDGALLANARLGLIEALVRAGERQQALAERDHLLARRQDPAIKERLNDIFVP